MANIYLQSGFLDFDKMCALSSALNIVIGPRNAGKTYGALLHYTGAGVPFVFMRTAKKDIDIVFSEELSPFNKLNRDVGTKYAAETIKGSGGLVGVYDHYSYNENGIKTVDGNLIGYCISLTQVGSVRGFNLDNVQVVLYDEFVRHPGEVVQYANKQLSRYADIIFTMNRAREIEGRPPLKQWLFGNSDDLANNILMELQLVNIIIGMRSAGENYRKIDDRNISIFLCDDSPVAKRLNDESALSKIFAGSSYLNMAYGNAFINDDYSDCIPQNIRGFVPVFVYDDICIMRHRNRDEYYARKIKPEAKFDGIPVYRGDVQGTINARENHAFLYYSWLAGIIKFESYPVKMRFLSLYNIDKK